MTGNTFLGGLKFAATILAGIISLSLVFALIATIITTITADPTGPLPDTGSFPYATTAATTLIFLTPVLLAPWMHYGQGFAASMPRRPRAPLFIAATGLTWFAMGTTGVAHPWIEHALGQPQFEGLNITDGQMIFIAFNAGLGEEATYLAAPTGLIFLLGSLINLWLTHRHQQPISAQKLWTLAAIVGPGLVLAGRATGHLYQGEVSALLGLTWGATLAVIFFWVRSVWPLMLGHIIYDLPVHYETWAELISHHVIAPAIISIAALFWVRYAKRARRNRQAHHNMVSLPE